MQNTDFSKLLEKAVPQLREGAFLVSGEEGNPMTIGWATFGIIWGKPICTVLVRHSRHTHKLMEEHKSFTVSVPENGAKKAELAFCGSRSGRDTDKKKDLDMSVTETENGGKLISDCKMHFVCKTVAKTEMDMSSVDEAILQRFYNTNQATSDGDPHTIYFGEIVEAFAE